MPYYVHQCKKCKNRQEEFYPIKSADKIKIACKRCKGSTQRVLHAPHLVFYGSGWATKEIQADRQLQLAKEAMSEPLTPTELNELPDIAKEEEKKRGLEPGSILNQRKRAPSKVTDKTLRNTLSKKAGEQRREVEKIMTGGYGERVGERKKEQKRAKSSQ